MSKRDTTTGAVLRQNMLHILQANGYICSGRINIGQRITGGGYFVDSVVEDGTGNQLLCSFSYQGVQGTAERKVPFEVICLADTIRNSHNLYKHGYLVLDDDGWTMKDYFLSGELNEHLKYGKYVTVLSVEDFIQRITRRQL